MRQLLRRPDFRVFFLALTVSMVAESVLLLALGVWVKELTGSDGLAGATFVALTAPMVLAPLLGWVVDRAPRRALFVVLNALTAILLLPLLTVRDDSRLWIVYAVAVGYGLSYIALGATVTALVQEIVPAALLPDANGAAQTVKQGLRLAGPLLGAGLYVLLGGPMLAAACALGFLLAGVLGLALHPAAAPAAAPVPVSPEVEAAPAAVPVPPDVEAAAPACSGHTAAHGTERDTAAATAGSELGTGPAAGAATGGAGGGRGALVAGVRHLVAEPALRRALVAVVVATVGLGFGETLWFAYVDQGLGQQPAFLGVLVSIQGVGGLVGGIGSAPLVRRVGELGTVALGVAALAAGSLALVRPGIGLAVAGSLLIGLGLPVSMVGTMTLVQRRTPGDLVGRVSAALDALASGPQAVAIGAGALLVGLADYRLLYGVIGALLVAAAGYLLTGRRLTAPPAGPAPEAGPAPALRTAGAGAPAAGGA